MRLAAFVLAAVATVACAQVTMDRLVHDDEFVGRVQRMAKTWTAGHNGKFDGWTLSQAKKLMGTRMDKVAWDAYNKLPKVSYTNLAAPPQSFDERTKWPACTIMSEIRDQAACGSCWAFGTVEAFNDRRCAASNGAASDANVMLSAQDVTSCCSGFTCFGCSGCDGGIPSVAWQYLVNMGVVTGGDYDTTGTCLPYELPPCDHHVNGPRPNCTEGGSTPSCSQQCISGYSKSWSSDKHMAKTTYGFNTLTDVQNDILQYGSVTAAFDVYADFLSYKSGVYQHTTGEYLGGHAISILGWGVESGTPYWLVRNSWNTNWGDQGYFKILRGSDECGIEDQIVAGTAA